MGSDRETCLICLTSNYDDKTLLLYDLTTLEWENLTYLNKLEYLLNAEIVVYDSTLICSNCLHDLNTAYEFKEKVTRSLEYWSVRFEENANSEAKQNEEKEIQPVEETNTEINTYTGNKTVVNESDNKVLNEPEHHALNDDNKNVHSEHSTFLCSKCSCTFLTASELIHHSCGSVSSTRSEEDQSNTRKRAKKQKSEAFECEICDLPFTKRWKLNKHLKTHMVDKKYVCTFCNRAFKQFYHLKEHITSHTGERKYSCNICGKRFQRTSSQRRHMKTHAALPGEKSKKSPFLCNICGKSFPYSNGAQRHMRIHTGDKRYECKICGRKFNQSTHLIVHLRTHTGERPYMCNICGGAYSIKASLHKHMKAHDESKDDIKILQNLEPNLSQTESKEDSDEIKKSEYDDYDEGFLIVINK